MALSTQFVITSLMEKFSNENGEIVGLTQDELVRSIQQIDVKPKATKAKKVKDPNAPKRPTSAYMFWLNESRKTISEEHCSHLTGKAKVTATTRKAGELWREMSDEDKSPFKDKFLVAQQKYAAEKANYVPSQPKIVYDVDHFPEALDGWSGPFEMKYLSKIAKDDDGKNIPIFKNFEDAVAKANELPVERCFGITKTVRGYQLRVGHDLITNPPEHAGTGLASWIKGEPSVPEAGISTEMDASKLVKYKKKVSFETREVSDTDAETPKKRGRGRPKGSKNKSKESSPKPESDSESEPAKKRGRGRPKGSKNKTNEESSEPVNQPEPTKDTEDGVSVEEIELDIGEGCKTYYIDSDTMELYDQQTSEKIGELNDEGKFLKL